MWGIGLKEDYISFCYLYGSCVYCFWMEAKAASGWAVGLLKKTWKKGIF